MSGASPLHLNNTIRQSEIGPGYPDDGFNLIPILRTGAGVAVATTAGATPYFAAGVTNFSLLTWRGDAAATDIAFAQGVIPGSYQAYEDQLYLWACLRKNTVGTFTDNADLAMDVMFRYFTAGEAPAEIANDIVPAAANGLVDGDAALTSLSAVRRRTLPATSADGATVTTGFRWYRYALNGLGLNPGDPFRIEIGPNEAPGRTDDSNQILVQCAGLHLRWGRNASLFRREARSYFNYGRNA